MEHPNHPYGALLDHIADAQRVARSARDQYLSTRDLLELAERRILELEAKVDRLLGKPAPPPIHLTTSSHHEPPEG
jgi:hypothetical protein